MINDILLIALQMKKFADEHYKTTVQMVYDYIENIGKKVDPYLSHTPFDLEEWFSFIDLQLNEALESGNESSVMTHREI